MQIRILKSRWGRSADTAKAAKASKHDDVLPPPRIPPEVAAKAKGPTEPRTPGQRSYLSDLGFAPDELPSDTNAWGFSFAVLRRVSNALVETCSETFRLTQWSVLGTNPTGSSSQLTLWRPVPSKHPGESITKGEVAGESLIKSTPTNIGVSLTYLSQLYKEPARDPDDDDTILSKTSVE